MLPKHLHKYFWDTDAEKVDVKKDGQYIIAKLLEYGDIPDIKWMFQNFDKELIKKVFMERRGFSPRVANFWRLYFDIPENKIVCLKKQFQKKQKILWPY